ncbi:hypothetical protein MKX01_016422 [Papaver californicum]|nr:hypothetical protein MKX01_016422 [Papaver californicum]
MEKSSQIYHEKQKLQSVYWMLSTISSKKLVLVDPNRENQKWVPLIFKQHHNSITWNYDINVLISALEQKGKSTQWHVLMGIIFNIPIIKFRGLWKSRYWVALKSVQGIWYNLDSDLSTPYIFRDAAEVKEFLDFVISCGAEVLLVLHDKE